MNAITKGGYQDVPMSRRRAQLLAEYAERLATMLENAPDDKDLAEWVQSKIDRAASAIQSAYHYLDQEDDLEKGAGHKYTHRKRVGTDKRGRARYRYYYQEHHGGGITRAKLEAGSAFKLTFRGRRGHFHIESVEGDTVTVRHDGRANSKPVQMTKAEFRALIKRQHGQALASHTEKLRRQVDKLKRNPTRKRSSLGLALHRLRQAAEKAGVTLPEEYQRKPKKKTAQTTETPREDRFDTMPEVEDLANKKTSRERSLALRGYKSENLIEIAAHAFLQDKAVNEEVDAKVRELEREHKDLANTAARLGSEEELAKEGGNYRYQDAEQAAREKHEEIQNLLQSRIDIYNKVYRSVVSHLRDQKTNYVERRKAIQSRIKELTVSVDTSETMPTARDQLTSTAQEIITEADQDHDERHDEHQSIEQFELGEHTHTKTGVKLFTAKQKGRTDRDEYRRRVEIAKKHGGRYERRYVKGFLFKTAEDARNFALEVEGGQVEESAETATPHEDHPQADNFETMVEVESAPVQTADIRTPILRAVEQATPAHPTGYSSDTRGALTIGGFNAEVYGYPTKKEAVADARAKGHKAGDVVPVSNRFWTGYAISRIDPTTKERVFFDKTSAEPKAIKVPLADKATHQKRGHLFHEGGDIRTIRRVQGADNLETIPEPDPSPARQALTETAREVVQGEDRFETMPEVESTESREPVQDERFEYGLELEALAKRAGLKYSEQGVARSVDARIVRDNEPHVRIEAPQLQKVYPKLTQQQVNDFKARAIAYLKEFTGDDLTEDIQHTAQSNQTRSRMIYKELDAAIGHIINEVSEGGRYERKATLQAVKMLAEWRESIQQPTPPREQAPEPNPSPARQALTETADEIMSPSTSALNIDQANAQDTLTENRTRNPESKAADKALIESARELAKTSERGDEIRAAVLDLMNAQQLKRYKRATGETGLRAEDMIEKRRAARERLRGATSGATVQGEDNFETMPETEAQPKRRTGPNLSRYKRALSLAKKGKRLDTLTNGRRSKASREADQALISIAQEILEKDLGDVEVRTIYRKPSTMWTREESLKVAIGAMAGELKTRQRALGGRGGAEQAQELRADAREKLIDAIQEHVDRFLPDEVIDARLDRDLARDAREAAKQEAREAQEARLVQQKTFTPEIQSAIDNLRHPYQSTRVDSFESHFKTRKDGGVFRSTLTPKDIAVKITSSLPQEINQFIAGKHTLSSEITTVIEQGIEDRKTIAEIKDMIGEEITTYARDVAVIDRNQIHSGKALVEFYRNITALTGTGLFDGDSMRREERFRRLPYIGLERLKNDIGDINERIKASVSMGHVFTRRLSEQMQRYEERLPNRVRFNSSGPEVVTAVYAEAYPTVGDIRENISEIRDDLRTMIKEGLNGVTSGVANPEVIFNRIKSGYEKATEQKNRDREESIERSKKLAQYTDDPQAHLAEIQERERKSAQEISEQVEVNSEFADAYLHEASKIIEDATENTKGELIDKLLGSRSGYQLEAPVEGRANRKLMARIFNEVFEQVRREIGDEPIERGEKHPRNIADTVKNPSKTPAQFRDDIERDQEEKKARARAKREARRAQRTQKSALHLTNYRADLYRTIERLAS